MTQSVAKVLLLLSALLFAAVEVAAGDATSTLEAPASPPPPPQPTTPPPAPRPTPQPTTPLLSPSSRPTTALCDQEQLILVATTIARLELKKQCEAAIREPEMLQTGVPETVCGVSSCVAALQTMYRTLPRCNFRDWDVQFHAEMLLRNCGIKPKNDDTQGPDADDCSLDAAAGSASSMGSKGSAGDSGSGSSRFAPREAFAGEQEPSSSKLFRRDAADTTSM